MTTTDIIAVLRRDARFYYDVCDGMKGEPRYTADALRRAAKRLVRLEDAQRRMVKEFVAETLSEVPTATRPSPGMATIDEARAAIRGQP